MTWPTPPAQGTDPWYTPFLTMWANLRTYIDTGLSGKADSSHGDHPTDADVDANTAHRGLVTGNPHGVTAAETGATPDSHLTGHIANDAVTTHEAGNDHPTDADVAAKVAKSGDTMTGALTLPGAPTVDLHAATKKYVDDNAGGGGADGAVIEDEQAAVANVAPAAGTGADGDYALGLRNTGGANDFPRPAYLWGPKAAGAWPSTPYMGAGNYTRAVVLAQRTESMKTGVILPGWQHEYLSGWWTGTLPNDMNRANTFGGAGYSSVSGTMAMLCFQPQMDTTTTAPLAFFSCDWDIDALPEASRYAWAGNLLDGAGATPYGYAARVDSAGTVTLWKMSGIGGNTQLGTGSFTVSAGDRICVQRFANQLWAYKVASGSRNATSHIYAHLVNTQTDDGFSYLFGAASFGYCTDSNSVRLGRLDFSG